MKGQWAHSAAVLPRAFFCVGLAIALSVQLPSALAIVKIFDGFGDADVDNNGVAAEPADTDVGGAGTGTVGTYNAANNGGTPPVFPLNTVVNEVTAATDPSDVGIKWFSISGFSGTAPSPVTPRVAVHIIDDSPAALPETNPAIGYYSTAAGANRFATAIGSGLALAAESKGRANQAAGFFGQQIQLGPQVGDAVKVSFDFRVWFSAPNFNDQSGEINHVPNIGEIRFGMYEDTDQQLGLSNSVAGPGGTSAAIWGQANGNFRGDNGTVGAQGDRGWFARVPIDNVDSSAFDKSPNGADARVVEETNDQASATDKRIMNGASDAVAQPPSANPQFVNLDLNKVYNLSMTLARFDDPATEGTTGDTILATIIAVDRATGQQYSFSNYERVINATTMVPDGISSDKWNYFAMGIAGATDSDDFDWLIDNFKVEVNGSNAGVTGDYNGNGVVDAADYVVWRNGGSPDSSQAGYNLWRSKFGNTSGSGSVAGGGGVPEPTGLAAVFVVVAALGAAWRRRNE